VREAGFDLARCVLAMGTSNHAKGYNIISFDLDNHPPTNYCLKKKLHVSCAPVFGSFDVKRARLIQQAGAA
jgi:hypothetical protein